MSIVCAGDLEGADRVEIGHGNIRSAGKLWAEDKATGPSIRACAQPPYRAASETIRSRRELNNAPLPTCNAPAPRMTQRHAASEESRTQRAVILHIDDLGMCPGANRAFLELAAAGQVTCGSVLVPCPSFGQIAEAAAADATLDLGVHLTLTSEWERLRWHPLSTRSKPSGLIDDDGYFWRDVRALAAHLVLEAAEEELRTQIERAFTAGMQPTHIDAHMGAANASGPAGATFAAGARVRPISGTATTDYVRTRSGPV